MLRTLEDSNIIRDYLFYEYMPLCSSADYIIVDYIIFEIFRSGEDAQLFLSTQLKKDIGFCAPAQVRALEVASANGILEVDVLRSKGKNITFGKVIKEMLYGE
jgi:hypothetical protein